MSFFTCVNQKWRTPSVFLFFVLSIAILIFSLPLTCAMLSSWHGVVVGIVLTLIAIPFHRTGHSHSWGHVVSFLLTAVSNGFSLSALYRPPVNLSLLCRGAFPSVVILFAVCVVLFLFPKAKSAAITLGCLADMALAVVSVVYWIKTGATDVSFAFFCSLICLFFLCVYGITANHEKRNVLRDISFGGFGAFVMLTVVVVFILSEGELLDGFGDLDVPDFGGGKRDKK